ncbi:FAD-dependent oxidoreductase [Stetteria hydrogenophila]
MAGAGIVGLATAFHLKRLNPGARVLVVERSPRRGRGYG